MCRSRFVKAAVGAAMVALAAPQVACAQQAEQGPRVGDIAPEFALTGATRYGILRDRVKLSDYRGNTVVLAFFFKARTRG
jgi:peroxiredoxin Q/BCP